MANPQKENGYTAIANELLAALCRHHISGAEFMIVLTVISKTYGWNKKEAQISLTQFQKATCMTRKRVIRAIKTLVSCRVLGSVTGGTSSSSTYWIIKDYEKWIALPSVTGGTTPSVTGGTTPSVTGGTTPSVISNLAIYTKDKLKTKTVGSEAAVVFEHFRSALQKPKFLLTKEREALIAKRLKEGYTVDQLCSAITNFSKDDWPERHKYCDLPYAIGTIRGINNLEKWLDFKPKDNAPSGHFR